MEVLQIISTREHQADSLVAEQVLELTPKNEHAWPKKFKGITSWPVGFITASVRDELWTEFMDDPALANYGRGRFLISFCDAKSKDEELRKRMFAELQALKTGGKKA